MFGGPGIFPSQRGQTTNTLTVQAGGGITLIPPGNWFVKSGLYATLQEYDPTSNTWRTWGSDGVTGLRYVASDGNNWRLVNTTGCVVGAIVTTAGSGYTSTPTVTVSAGGATLAAIVGGAVSTTVTVTNGGTSYTYPPMVQFQSPGYGTPPDLCAAGYCTLSGTSVSTVTVTQQGAGYGFVPVINFINDPRDTTGTGAAATATLTGSQTITAIICTNPGTGIQTAVPTISFSGGGGSSAVATAIMDWTVTAYSATGGGAGYTAPVQVVGAGGVVSGTAANTKPLFDKGLVTIRQANILAALSTSTITATGQTVIDGGRYQAAPTALVFNNYAPSTVATLALTMGGTNETVLIFPSA